MIVGPQIDCRSCGFPMLLAFVKTDGERRQLQCSGCTWTYEWIVDDIRDPQRFADTGTRATPDFSVE